MTSAPEPEPVPDRLLDAAQVAERLTVPESWVREQTRAGTIPHVTLGRYRRYEWEAVVGWLEAQRAGQWRKHRPSVSGRTGEEKRQVTPPRPARGVVSTSPSHSKKEEKDA